MRINILTQDFLWRFLTPRSLNNFIGHCFRHGVFNNTSEKYIRDFLADKARILAVVGLDVNTFKPHTGTKTSVIFLQKWDKEKCLQVDDYPIFFAVSEKSGKDNSGEYIYKEVDGKKELQHDLDEIAEEFVKWAKGEGMEFWSK